MSVSTSSASTHIYIVAQDGRLTIRAREPLWHKPIAFHPETDKPDQRQFFLDLTDGGEWKVFCKVPFVETYLPPITSYSLVDLKGYNVMATSTQTNSMSGYKKLQDMVDTCKAEFGQNASPLDWDIDVRSRSTKKDSPEFYALYQEIGNQVGLVKAKDSVDVMFTTSQKHSWAEQMYPSFLVLETHGM